MTEVPYVRVTLRYESVDRWGRSDDSPPVWIAGLAELPRTTSEWPDTPTHEIRWIRDGVDGRYYTVSLEEPTHEIRWIRDGVDGRYYTVSPEEPRS